jgi:hypothetical protein
MPTASIPLAHFQRPFNKPSYHPPSSISYSQQVNRVGPGIVYVCAVYILYVIPGSVGAYTPGIETLAVGPVLVPLPVT